MAEPMRTSTMLMTPQEFLTHPLEDVKAELVRGELRVTPPPGGPHACATANLVFALTVHVKARGLGFVFGDGAGFELLQLPHTVRVPDASFVRADRIPESGVGPGLLRFAPDLAVEVLSPSESASEIQEKLDDYQMSGTPLIWVVDPVKRTIAVYARSSPPQWLHESDSLEGGDVVPGFLCRVTDVFEGIARGPT